MPPNPPQTLSVKRKRNEAPVDALVIENDGKRFKSGNFSWKLVPNPKASVPPALLSPSTAERRFFLDPAAARRVKHVFVEARPTAESKSTTADRDLQAATTPEPTPAGTPRPRKRPGAGSALNKAKEPPADHKQPVPEPSADDVRRFEEFSKSVEKEEAGHKHITSPLKYKPKAPAQRFKDRHPEKAAEMDHDAMDVDSDEYVYDTYIRQDIVPDANGRIPEPQGTVGFIVIGEDDEEWWNGDDESDKEFATDDEDENAEDYYANDYPEDELSSDDEYDRNLYQRKYRHGSDDEEYDLNDDGDDEHMRSDEDDDDKHFRMTAAQTKKPKPAGYWGKYGE